MSISSTASSAERPRHGAPAAWALSPLKLYSTDTSAFDVLSPQLTCMLAPTCAKIEMSTSLNAPAFT